VLGSAGEGVRLDIPADRLMRKDLKMIGNLAYTSASWRDMLDLMAIGRVRPQRLVTHRFALQDFAEGLRLMEQPIGRVVKILLEHGGQVL